MMPDIRKAVVARAAAPGKVILLGEHAVVYGRTALAAAIDRYVQVCITSTPRTSENAEHAMAAEVLTRATELMSVSPRTFETTISSNLPSGVGLGSSAALSVALIRALAQFVGREFDAAAVCAHAFELEKVFHGFPSGVDNTVATHGGLIAFRLNAAVRALSIARPVQLVIALGRTPRRTRAAVTALRARWDAERAPYECLFDEVDELVTSAEHALGDGDLRILGDLMNANHAVLRRLGVSTDELDRLVALARAEGAWGAKLTGGGGGGAIICLGDTERLLAAFSQAGWQAFATTISTQPRGDHAGNPDRLGSQSSALA